MRIPPEKIEEIRSSNDIIDVVAQHVRLKKRGKNFVGLCPFHQEKTPSFTVSPEKQVYHCFGCAKGGNVFTFVMEFEKVSFTEAVRSLAERVGITITYTEADQQQQSEIESLYNACRFAGLFFYNNLTKTDEGKGALEYFHGRGFTDETIRSFGLGYSLNAWDGLLGRAREEGIAREDLLKAGLIRTREDGSDYDYFRGRAMFPIFSTSGRVVGFGARKLREDDPLGKYINSPETPVYNKSRILFGLFHAKDAIRSEETALMVEGYADLISLYQAGIRNVVASSGTALTEEQVQLIGRYCKKLTLVYDADSAGSNATLRGLDVALAQDLDVAIIELPEGEDPDSFVRKRGGGEFLKLKEQATSFIDFKVKQFIRTGAFSTPEGKAEAVRSIVQSIARMKDELKRNFYIKDVATRYDIYESVLHRELEQTRKLDSVRERERAVVSSSTPSSATSSILVQVPEEELPLAERHILKVLLENRPDLVEFTFNEITLDHITNEKIKRALELVLSCYEERGSIDLTSFLNELTDPQLRSLVTEIAVGKYKLSRQTEIAEADAYDFAKRAVLALKKRFLLKQRNENQRALREAKERGLDVLPYAQKHQELENQLNQLSGITLEET